MNILIVDDEQHVLGGIRNGVEWDRLPFLNRYEARNTKEARKILESVPIQVLLCDIEMPTENGLSLLEWLREWNTDIQTIFMTSYAEFNYAQRALQLGSFEYFLKPIEYEKLTEILRKAAENIEEKEIQKQYERYGYYWIENESSRRESFWIDLIDNSEDVSKQWIAHEIQKRHLDLGFDENLVLMVIRFVPKQKTDWRDDEMIQFRLCNQLKICLEERFADTQRVKMDAIWKESSTRWSVVFKVNDTEKQLWLELGSAVSKFRKRLKPFYDEFSVYFSEVVDVCGIYEQAIRIRQMMFNNIAYANGIFLVNEYKPDSEFELLCDVDRIIDLLMTEDEDGLQDYLKKLIDMAGKNPGAGEQVIHKLLVDWTQAIFLYLHRNKIEADKLFATADFRTRYIEAGKSVRDCRDYLNYIVQEAIHYRNYSRMFDDIIWKVEQYIEDHLEENLTRASIAEIVYLNPDYMAQMFKSKKGISLMKYIRNRRMEKAKEYLLTTELPVYSIALKTGYPTSSYFAKQFKEFYGIGPNEYRKCYG